MNDRLIRALLRQNVDYTPVWMMRQAGRYLPEYRLVRARAKDFVTLCKTPELACEVTLQPIHRFALDGAILFSDILTIPDAMGLGLQLIENEGPRFTKPVRTANDILQLGIPDPEMDLGYVLKAIHLIKHELKNRLPLIGFSGSPWTLACYMIEGGASQSFDKIKSMLYDEPQLLKTLLSKLTSAVTDYLNAQINAGVDCVMLFDTWGGTLTTSAYEEFSLLPLQMIISNLKRELNGKRIPIILFTKNSGNWLEKIAATGCDAIQVDWTIDIGEARKRVGHKVALQGNMDPAILKSSEARIRNEVQAILNSYGPYKGHIFNLGHGITPDVPPEHVAIMVDAVHEYSKDLKSQQDD